MPAEQMPSAHNATTLGRRLLAGSVEHHDAPPQPTLIATIGYQMTASSPRGTFSQAELTAELVTRRIWV